MICCFVRGSEGVPKLPKMIHLHWSTRVWSSMHPQFPRKVDFRVVLAFWTLDRVLGLQLGCRLFVHVSGVPST